nr:carboxylesterase 1-like [Ipomoea batatas]
MDTPSFIVTVEIIKKISPGKLADFIAYANNVGDKESARDVFYGTATINSDEVNENVNENEITVMIEDFNRIELSNEWDANLEVPPVDAKWLWTKIARSDYPLPNFSCFECNPDGSITRQRELRSGVEPTSAVDLSLVLTKDISINQSKTTWARIILPRKAVDSQPLSKLPLILYFHGGGFVVCKVDRPGFQDFYRHIATETSAVVISVGYRRAPEHRLPAAYDDCMEALYWIKISDDEWLTKYADFSRCFLMGTSAGGNIAYRVGLSASLICKELKPLEIRGLILHHPYFGGKERTGSELRSVDDKLFPLRLNELIGRKGSSIRGYSCNFLFFMSCHLFLYINRGSFLSRL